MTIKSKEQMREIKFRAKSIKTGKWIYGTYLHLGSGLHYIIPILHHYPISKECYLLYQIDPETLGQFTGLLDKNNKEIFEGDIIKDRYGRIMEITFKYGCYCCENKELDKWIFDTEMIEVIGNIYENPELLGVKSK